MEGWRSAERRTDACEASVGPPLPGAARHLARRLASPSGGRPPPGARSVAILGAGAALPLTGIAAGSVTANSHVRVVVPGGGPLPPGATVASCRRRGIHDAVVAASTDMQGALLVDKDGKVINEMSGDAFGHRVGDDLEIVRGSLCQILMDHISDAEFIFGDSIQAISQSSDGVRVEFTKNSPREFDLVIGADGLHSNVRRIVFGDESRFVRDLG